MRRQPEDSLGVHYSFNLVKTHSRNKIVKALSMVLIATVEFRIRHRLLQWACAQSPEGDG